MAVTQADTQKFGVGDQGSGMSGKPLRLLMPASILMSIAAVELRTRLA
jgi:hypothetical protein